MGIAGRGLIDPHGSGTTTTVSLATGLYRPTAGPILIGSWRVLRPRVPA